MHWFTVTLLVLGMLVVTPFLLRALVFHVIYPMQARSMKGAWTKDPRFYAYAEYFEKGSHRGGRRPPTGRRGGSHRGGRPHHRHNHASRLNDLEEVPELIPLD